MKLISTNIILLAFLAIGSLSITSTDFVNKSANRPILETQEDLQLTRPLNTIESTSLSPTCQVVDSLALIALYNSTQGWFWNVPTWQTWTRVCTWAGITLDAEGYVTEIFLNNKNLNGPLPNQIGDFARLEKLQIDNNNISGTIPPQITNLTTLEVLFIDDNNLTGELPANMGNMTSLITFFMDNNQITGEIPISMTTLPNLQDFQFFNNQIDSVPNLLTIPTLLPNKLRMQNNALTFDDVLPNMGFQLATFYHPQDSIWEEQTVTVPTGTNYVLDLDIDDGITTNNYTWFKDNVFYAFTSSNSLAFNNITWTDAGDYRCIVTNPGAPLLTLYSRTTTIVLECGTSVENMNPTICNDDEIIINGISYNSFNTSGTQTFPSADQHGCDSFLNINISFHNVPAGTFMDTLCDGESLVFNGTTYNQSNPTGTEFLPNSSYHGCDSFVNVDISFYTPIAAGNFNQTLCEGESVVINGTTYNQGNPNGTEILSDASFQGCDSTVLVNITFNSPAVNQIEQTLCPNGFIIVNGMTYDSGNPTGTEILDNASYQGCDSIINVDLSFDTPPTSNYTDNLCLDEEVTINGTIYNAGNPSGTEMIPSGSYMGCDSFINVSLNFFTPAVGSETPTLCEDGSILVNGTVYNFGNPSGTEVLTNSNFRGCDSTVNVSLSFFEVHNRYNLHP